MLNSSTHAPAAARIFPRALVAVALVASLLLTQIAPALAVNLNTVNTPVTQNFDTMSPNVTTALLPTDYKDDLNAGIVRVPGIYANAGGATTQTGGPSLSSTAAAGIYNFGSGSTNTGTDRAVGFLSSSSIGTLKTADLYAKYTNTTGSPLTALRISYDVEKYRTGTNAAGYRFQLFYSTDGSSWTDAGTNFLNSFPADATTAGCTPAPCSTTSVSNQVLAIPTVANNSDIYLAWNYAPTTGTSAASAQALAIDNISVTPLGSSVGANGYRQTDIQTSDDGGYAMVLQPDGKIVVGGYAVNNSLNKDFALVRYNYDGSLDTTFGGGGTGKVTTDFNNTSDRIWGLALQSDGKIVAVGETVSMVFPGTNDIAIARYTSAGVLDTTFNGTGKVVNDGQGLNIGGNNSAYGVAMSGTNIIVVGTESVNGNLDFLVQRYTTAGVLDSTFGNTLLNGGTVPYTPGETTTGFSGYNDVARAVAIDSNNKIVVGGYASNGSNNDFAIARYTTAGVLDTTFVAGAGKAALDLGNNDADQAFALAITPSTAPAPNANTIVLAGSTYNPSTGNKDFALVRYTSAGALDVNNFGSGGIKITDFNNSPDVAQSVYARSDGFIVAGGFSRYSTSSDDFAIARYTANGSLDPTLNGTGKLTMRISNNDERINAIAREFDGKIVAAGFATTPNSSPVQHDFAIARFNSDGSLDAATATALNNPDLLVTVTGPQDPNTVVAGGSFAWTVTVTNRGFATATNVVLTDTLPAGVSYVGSVASNGTANQSNGVVTNSIGTLAPGATATLTINVTAGNTPMLVKDTATATLAETDVSPSNNTASQFTRIIGIYDLSFSPSTVTGGCQNSTGTVTLTGAAPGNGVMVNIASTSPAVASAPAQVLVPGGASSAQFPVTTYTVQANTTARFEATLGPTGFVRRINVNAGACN